MACRKKASKLDALEQAVAPNDGTPSPDNPTAQEGPADSQRVEGFVEDEA